MFGFLFGAICLGGLASMLFHGPTTITMGTMAAAAAALVAAGDGAISGSTWPSIGSIRPRARKKPS